MFESLETRAVPALLIDVGQHVLEPLQANQSIDVYVTSSADAPAVNGFDLRAEIGRGQRAQSPAFTGVSFDGTLWDGRPHVGSGGPYASNPQLAEGFVVLTTGGPIRANGVVVKLSVSTLNVPAGTHALKLQGTPIGDSAFVNAATETIATTVVNGLIKVRSFWQNAEDANDVSSDGTISALDVLSIVNAINNGGSRMLHYPDDLGLAKVDTSGDGMLTPLDALLVIKEINHAPPVVVVAPPPRPDEPTTIPPLPTTPPSDPDDPTSPDDPDDTDDPDDELVSNPEEPVAPPDPGEQSLPIEEEPVVDEPVHSLSDEDLAATFEDAVALIYDPTLNELFARKA